MDFQAEKASAATNVSASEIVVVMLSGRRENDEYLRQTLDSLHVAKPSTVPVIFVNWNQPPEEHRYLNNWCAEHAEYNCLVPPNVSESEIQEAIVLSNESISKHQYLRVRTMQNEHALFGMRQFMNTSADYLLWLEDDVTVERDLFSSLPRADVVCLRVQGYCGMVAYMYKRSFIQKLILALEREKLIEPIDWIVDGVREKEGLELVRVPKAFHIGKVSSISELSREDDTKILANQHLIKADIVNASQDNLTTNARNSRSQVHKKKQFNWNALKALFSHNILIDLNR